MNPTLIAEAISQISINGNQIAAGMVGLGAAFGVAMVAAKAAESIGRNPGAFGNIFIVGLLGMAFVEGLAILAFFLLSK
ncbi:MAG: ATP synthase F0 subunit C [Methylacidiphilales bacterium]|nr:ATP synthase F0 subunit C [Candidatus Methylacidiphilales bacterium]MDW8349594.1 ATP synthase F0 subunit C [Verrucomicrobiae bacterium]